MNDDLISRSALKEAIRKRLGISSLNYLTEQERIVVEEIDNAPTITTSLKLENITEDDVEKFKMIWQRATSKGLLLISEDRPTGKWIKDDNGLISCSHCRIVWLRGMTDFCPNCGADMRGGKT